MQPCLRCSGEEEPCSARLQEREEMQPEMYAAEKGNARRASRRGEPRPAGRLPGSVAARRGKRPYGRHGTAVEGDVHSGREQGTNAVGKGTRSVPWGSAPTDAAARRPDTPSALPTRCDAVGYLTAGCSLMGAGSKAPQRIDFVFLIL